VGFYSVVGNRPRATVHQQDRLRNRTQRRTLTQ
jgi:hypothetical protein